MFWGHEEPLNGVASPDGYPVSITCPMRITRNGPFMGLVQRRHDDGKIFAVKAQFARENTRTIDELLADKYSWLGSHGIDMTLRRAQTALLYLGYNPGGVDGLAGNKTRSAMLQFQIDQGLPQSGEADALSCQRLNSLAF